MKSSCHDRCPPPRPPPCPLTAPPGRCAGEIHTVSIGDPDVRPMASESPEKPKAPARKKKGGGVVAKVTQHRPCCPVRPVQPPPPLLPPTLSHHDRQPSL